MFARIQKCQLDSCNRASSTKCFCCTKNVCTRHFLEHIELVKAQIDPLTNQINEMLEKIQDMTINPIIELSFAQLQQWQRDMHQRIDETFLAKSKEMEDLINQNKEKFVEHQKQQLENLVKIQDEIRQLVENDDITAERIHVLKSQITFVQGNLTSLKKNFLVVNIKDLVQGLVTVSSNLSKPQASSAIISRQYREFCY